MSEASSFCIGSCGSKNLSMNPVHPGFSLPGDPGALTLTYPEGFNLTNTTEAASASAAAASQSSANAASAGPLPATPTTPTYLVTTPTPGVRNVNYPPYVINNVQGDLAVQAISPNATHHDGTLDYDIHNLFGHQILNATYQALLSIFPGKRPFIIGRSTFAGSGTFAGHWGGDNFSLWAYMYFSIPQALSFSLFGIPMFGVDVSPFLGQYRVAITSKLIPIRRAASKATPTKNSAPAGCNSAPSSPSIATTTTSPQFLRKLISGPPSSPPPKQRWPSASNSCPTSTPSFTTRILQALL